MAEAIYLLCAVTSLGCAVLVLRGYHRTGTRLLLWSTACFALLGLNNVVLVVDLIVLPAFDLSVVRTGTALAAILLLLVGLIWDAI